MDGDVAFLREAVRELVDGPIAGSAADAVLLAVALGLVAQTTYTRQYHRMALPLKCLGIGGRHAHSTQAGHPSLRDQFQGHRRRIVAYRPASGFESQ